MRLAWDGQRAAVQNLLLRRAALPRLPEFQAAFALADRTLRCVDDGAEGGLHAAGSGILLGLDPAVERVRLARVDGITSHENCGAVLAWCRQAGLDPARSEQVAEEWARRLASAAGVPYRGHLSLAEMSRHDPFHAVIVVYYDGTGRFNPAAYAELPRGFVISRRYFDAGDLDLCLGIAFGEDGFGAWFTPEKPLYVVAVGDPADPQFSCAALESELRPRLFAWQERVALACISAPSRSEMACIDVH